MAARVPLASSRIDPLVELAGDAATFFDPKSEQEMAQAIWHLLTQHEDAARQVERGKLRAAAFTWKQSAQRTLGYSKGGAQSRVGTRSLNSKQMPIFSFCSQILYRGRKRRSDNRRALHHADAGGFKRCDFVRVVR